MQVHGLPRQFSRGARLASRTIDTESAEAAARRDVVARWRRARAAGLTADEAARAVGVSRATLYRWARRAEPRSRRPRRMRRPNRPPALVEAVRVARAEFPMWGKAKIAVLLKREGFAVSESTVGRILKALVERGAAVPVPALRRKAPRAARRARPYARRLPRGRKPARPGEIVQVDTMTVSLRDGRPPVKHFTACDPVARWTVAQAGRRATAANAVRFLDKLLAAMPFPVEAIQVDGGSEFKAGFEAECERRGIALYELPPRSPKLNGHVERANGSWRYEFYGAWDLAGDLERLNRWIDAFADEFNAIRPHQALGGRTPVDYLANRRTAGETPASHMS